jgi:hypothetical protein
MLKTKHIIDDVTTYLYGLQPNVDWNDFFNRYSTKTDEQILARIKSLLWVDKSITYNYKLTNQYVFEYYTKLIGKIPDIDQYSIYIIDINEDTKLDDYFIRLIKHKIGVLITLLTLRGFKYKLISSLQSQQPRTSSEKYSGIMFPTGSISYPSSVINSIRFEGIIVDDGCFNLTSTPHESDVNHIKLMITSVIETPLTIPEVIATEFGILDLNKFIPK